MKPKTIKIIYWVLTGLFCLGMLFSGVSELLQVESGKLVMEHLGYPDSVNIIIGVAKILGVLAILQWKYKTLKEWAYSGFIIDFIGAGASFYFVGDKLMALSPLPFIVLLFASYYFWKKKEAIA